MNRQQLFNEAPLVGAAVVGHEERSEAERVARTMAYLDNCGATFEAVPGWLGWYAARWSDEANFGDHVRRWACCTVIEMDCEWPYALAFRARVEEGGLL
ncbi:hypothetical protein B6S44_24800 [Bosea sp. Tri-44]|uniref:hypothetical protein n=1 Tax=Bosea sp. Tri-44 TaxID=1972137 RepID=UPI001025D4A1|nr:hypothetical protein [Bosea sp. Tri-44]RXT47892.1 hypothetical protein B6S44_24800 [Bosea sp. Tri-44]